MGNNYCLIENGSIHTEDLNLSEASEMLTRHMKFFPNCIWEIREKQDTKTMDKAYGLMERQRNAYRVKK